MNDLELTWEWEILKYDFCKIRCRNEGVVYSVSQYLCGSDYGEIVEANQDG